MQFHHLGIACSDIIKTRIFLKKTFNIVSSSEIIFDKNQNVNLCLLTNESGTNIELVSGKTVDKFIKKNQYLYHSCWEVTDLNQEINNFCINGAILISEPMPAKLFNGRHVAFLFTELGIIELLEKSV